MFDLNRLLRSLLTLWSVLGMVRHKHLSPHNIIPSYLVVTTLPRYTVYVISHPSGPLTMPIWTTYCNKATVFYCLKLAFSIYWVRTMHCYYIYMFFLPLIGEQPWPWLTSRRCWSRWAGASMCTQMVRCCHHTPTLSSRSTCTSSGQLQWCLPGKAHLHIHIKHVDIHSHQAYAHTLITLIHIPCMLMHMPTYTLACSHTLSCQCHTPMQLSCWSVCFVLILSLCARIRSWISVCSQCRADEVQLQCWCSSHAAHRYFVKQVCAKHFSDGENQVHGLRLFVLLKHKLADYSMHCCHLHAVDGALPRMVYLSMHKMCQCLIFVVYRSCYACICMCMCARMCLCACALCAWCMQH